MKGKNMSSTTSITILVKSPNNHDIYDYLSKLYEFDICGVNAELEVYEPEWEIIDTIMVMTSVRGTVEIHDLKNSIECMFEQFEDVNLEIEIDNLETGDYGKLSIDKEKSTYHYLDNYIVKDVLDQFGDFYDNIYETLDEKLITDGEVIKF